MPWLSRSDAVGLARWLRQGFYDYVDRDVPALARMAAKRAAGYSASGYTIARGPGLFEPHVKHLQD